MKALTAIFLVLCVANAACSGSGSADSGADDNDPAALHHASLQQDIDRVLATRGVERLKVEISRDEVARQTTYGGSVRASDALDIALRNWMEDESDPESPLGLVGDLESDAACKRSNKRAAVKCLLNDGDSSIKLVTESSANELPERVDVRKSWVFSLYVGNLSDHGHWVVVDRNGHEPVRSFNFN